MGEPRRPSEESPRCRSVVSGRPDTLSVGPDAVSECPDSGRARDGGRGAFSLARIRVRRFGMALAAACCVSPSPGRRLLKPMLC